MQIQDRLKLELDYLADRYRGLFYWQVLAAIWLVAAAAILPEGKAEHVVRLKATGLKMPQLAVPVRLLVFGLEQTPSVDAMLAALLPR